VSPTIVVAGDQLSDLPTASTTKAPISLRRRTVWRGRSLKRAASLGGRGTAHRMPFRHLEPTEFPVREK